MAQQTNKEINGSKYYRVRRVIGHTYVNGRKKPICKDFYGVNRKDALRKYEEWKGEKINFADTPFNDAVKYYVDNVLVVSDYAQSTIGLYVGAYRSYVKGKIYKPLCDLTTRDIQEFYNKLNVTKAVMKSVSKFMSGFFKWASQNDYCHNITDNVIIPKKKDNKQSDGIVLWTDEELSAIQNTLGNNRLRFFVICAMYEGLRLSELKGLKYSDFRGDFIRVERQAYKGEIKPPKWNSVRSVPIHEVVREELERHKEWHKREMRRNHYHTDYIFTTSSGKPYEDANIHRALTRFYDNIGVPHKKLHAYRSTFCTNLCKWGVPIQVASKLLGHKSIEVTAKYYAAVSDDLQMQAVSMLPDFSV